MVSRALSHLPDHLIPTIRLDTPASLRQRQKQTAFYAYVTGAELERLVPLTTKADLLVWLHLRSLQLTKGAEAWTRVNPSILLAWGVRPRSSQRAILNLASAGILEADARPGRKTRVRLLPLLPDAPEVPDGE